MLLSAVSVLVVTLPSSEVQEGLINYPVHFYNMKIEASTFVAVAQRYKCGKTGHINKFCTKERRSKT
jgi:hypothetical protein